MKERKIKLYTFDELSDEVRNEKAEKASFSVMDEHMIFSSNSDYESSLEAFEKATGFRAKDRVVGYNKGYFSVQSPDFGVLQNLYEDPVFPEECKGKLLWRWCRRFIDENRERKYYSKFFYCEKSEEHPNGWKLKVRRSKVLKEDIEGGWCPWTGCFTDCPLVEPIVDFYLNYHRGKFSEEYTLEDLITDCLDKFFRMWRDEYEYYGDNKDNCVEETLSVWYDSKLFFADGTEFHGILEDDEEEYEEAI
jgi:hypothetical protein